MKNEKLVLQIGCFIGVAFASSQIINSLFFQTTPSHILRFPIYKFYGLQLIPFQLIIFIMILLYINARKSRQIFNLFIIWNYCLINSIWLRMNDFQYYSFEFIFILLIINILSIFLIAFESLKKNHGR